MVNFKRLDDGDLYEYLYMRSVEECDIPKSRKARIAMCKVARNNQRRKPQPSKDVTL